MKKATLTATAICALFSSTAQAGKWQCSKHSGITASPPIVACLCREHIVGNLGTVNYMSGGVVRIVNTNQHVYGCASLQDELNKPKQGFEMNAGPTHPNPR